jgi:hypothetical protein
VLLALSVVMAGSGHLPTFKLLRGGLRGERGAACRSLDVPWSIATFYLQSAGLRKRVATPTVSNASQPSPASPPTSSLNYGSHCAVR